MTEPLSQCSARYIRANCYYWQ